jgi:homocysteine S-methyltransferase
MSADLTWMQQRLDGDGGPIVIDGGMGTMLQQSGVPMHDRIWSAAAVLSQPDAVRRAHHAFIEAGAEVIITNTFAAGRHMLEAGGFGDRVGEINTGAVQLARQARADAGMEPVAIAGSICEWTPADSARWNSSAAVGRAVREQAGLLARAGVDLLALEMCERIDYSVAAIEAALEFELPLWIGVSARLQPGSATLSVFDYAALDFDSLVRRLARYPAMIMNVMHTPVTDVDAALASLRRHWQGPVGVYPESGYFTAPNWNFVDVIEPAEFAVRARAWVDSGVRLVGGCCGLGAEHIAALRQAFTD